LTGQIGLDSNVVLRWLFDLAGDETMTDRAREALNSEDIEVHLNLVVLAELNWVARNTLKLPRDGQVALIESLLIHPRIQISERECVSKALSAFRQGGVGFADHLIAALNHAAGCNTTLTFDKTAAKADGFTLLT
jgi:predicted nucleic-acid-binding protein